MAVFIVLVPVTLLVVLGYFVFFAASKAEGPIKSFGKYLSIWVFILAGLLLLAAAFGPRLGLGWPMRGFGRMMVIDRPGPGARHFELRSPRQLPPRAEQPDALDQPDQPDAPDAPDSPPSN